MKRQPLWIGQVVAALETRVNPAGNPRIRFLLEGGNGQSAGWANVVSGDGTLLLELM